MIEYGFMPELVPRFRNITVLYPLTTGDLYRILTETPDSALQQQIRLFEAHSVELVITKEALEAVCEKAHGDRSGARGLDLHIRRSLRKLSPTELERDRVRQIVIDEECVAANGASPQITFHKKSDCQATPASKLRESAVQFKNGGESEEISGASVGTSPWLLDQAIEQLKNSSLDWANATGLARDWWRNFEEAYSDRRAFVHSLALELSNRNATINEFFELTIGADTTDVGTRLIFFDYQRRLTREKGGIRSLFRPYSGFQDDEYETGGFESDLYLPNDDDFFDDEDRFDADPDEGESGDEDETD
ncbi:MAG: hypothetical protein IPJ30_02065 [Acidobacteria bacterium]|nr:hypothetical protein [Acidobacteriota bacterium]